MIFTEYMIKLYMKIIKVLHDMLCLRQIIPFYTYDREKLLGPRNSTFFKKKEDESYRLLSKLGLANCKTAKKDIADMWDFTVELTKVCILF